MGRDGRGEEASEWSTLGHSSGCRVGRMLYTIQSAILAVPHPAATKCEIRAGNGGIPLDRPLPCDKFELVSIIHLPQGTTTMTDQQPHRAALVNYVCAKCLKVRQADPQLPTEFPDLVCDQCLRDAHEAFLFSQRSRDAIW